jgi:hypothetical protein
MLDPWRRLHLSSRSQWRTTTSATYPNVPGSSLGQAVPEAQAPSSRSQQPLAGPLAPPAAGPGVRMRELAAVLGSSEAAWASLFICTLPENLACCRAWWLCPVSNGCVNVDVLRGWLDPRRSTSLKGSDLKLQKDKTTSVTQYRVLGRAAAVSLHSRRTCGHELVQVLSKGAIWPRSSTAKSGWF